MLKKLLFVLLLLCSIYVYSTDIAYINSDTRKQVKASGAAITQSDYLTLPYYANPELTINIIDSNGNAVDLSYLYSAYQFLVMDSYKAGNVVVNTLNTDIDSTEADSGIIVVDANTSSTEMHTALSGKTSILGTGALLCFATGDLVHPKTVFPLQIVLESIPDMGQTPTGTISNYYNKNEIDALLANAGIGLNIDDVKADTDIADALTKKHAHANSAALALVSGTNTGDETVSTIKTKLGISTLSGSNTGDQDLSNLVVKVTGKELSENDYTDTDKNKLDGIEAGAEVNNISDVNATDLTDAGATTLHKHSYNNLDDKPTIPDELSDLLSDSTHRTVTDSDTARWDAKSNFDGSYNSLTDTPTIPDSTSDLSNDSGFITSGDIPAIPDALSDLTEDSTHRVITDTERTYWDAKQPAGSYLIASDISGKEDTSNKVTAISSESTDTQYPSAKLVYDQLAGKQASGTYSTDIHSNITDLNAVSGTNTGDNATNSQYSGLAASKLDLHATADTALKANQLTTARTIFGQNFNGSANVTGMATISNIGLLGSSPVTTSGIYAVQNFDNPANNQSATIFLLRPTYTGAESVAESFFNYRSFLFPIINTGHVNSGEIANFSSETYRNCNAAGSDDNGTLYSMSGISISYGHFNTNPSATPRTTKIYGLIIKPYIQTGLADAMYDIYLGAANTGGTVTDGYGVYQANTKNNYFAGNIGIGITPTSKLTLAAGSATANTAPLKFTSGPIETTPRAGLVEYDGSAYYFTTGTSTLGRIKFGFGPSQTNNSSLVLGVEAGGNNTQTYSTLIGYQAGKVASVTGLTCVGAQAGLKTSSGNYPTFVGLAAGGESTSGNGQVGVGAYSGAQLTGGNYWTAVGSFAGYYYGTTSTLTSAVGSTFIGYNTRASANSNTNETVIGYDTVGNGSNTVTIGNDSVTATYLKGTVNAAAVSCSPTISTGTSAPTSTPLKIGDIFVDTTNHKIYVADGTDSTRWQLCN